VSLPLLPTSLVGSYAQPEWLIDRAKLAGRFPPRVRARELWRIPPEHLAEAQDDATIVAVRLQEEPPRELQQPLRHRARRRRRRQPRHRA
jgi:5-methyltetrahydropteroyltriglutamate--homocysteine methyltransferase